MKPDELRQILAKPGYSVVASGVSRKQPKPQQREKPMGVSIPSQEGAARPFVIITRCSTGSLDRDNLNSANKALIDALCLGGYITGDREADIELICLQRKVKRGETGTLIEIIK